MSNVSSREFRIDVGGDVVEWQTLLSGMQIATLEGAAADGAWALAASCSWNPRTGSGAIEGDLALSNDDGSELFATLSGGTVAELPADAADAADYDARLEFTIDGGAGGFDAATGTISAEGRLSRSGFSLHLRISLNDA